MIPTVHPHQGDRVSAMGSPPIERGILILEFLATHPGRAYSLTQLARRLGLSKSTTASILQTLEERAWALREPDSLEYRLGPALVPMGSAAERTLPALTLARRQAE